MHGLNLTGGRPLRILCLGAHCDDIEIGCGGTLLQWLAEANDTHEVTWVAFSSNDRRERELRHSASRFLEGARRSEVIVHAFRDGHFPAQFTEIKAAFEELKAQQPDLIFTHDSRDLHQDHRVVAEMTRNTFRNHLTLAYEIPKYEGGLTTPNAYVSIATEHAHRKAALLLECYESQRDRRWFTADTFLAMMRVRGVESGGEHACAEGFHAGKLLLT